MLEIFVVPFYSEVLPTTLGQQIIQRKFELEKKIKVLPPSKIFLLLLLCQSLVLKLLLMRF